MVRFVIFSLWHYIEYSIPVRPLLVSQASPNVAGFSFLGGQMKHPSLPFSFVSYFDGLLGMQQIEAYGKSNIDYAIFQNFGYKGLYGGLDAKGIHTKKGLKKNEKILDHMGSIELAANLFRATQTEEKLQRDNIQSKKLTNQTHFEIGKKVRKTIEEIGGTMPENLLVVKRKVSAQLKKIGFAK